MKLRTVVIGIVFLGSAAVHAGGPKDQPSGAAAAFARLKTLVGRWEAQTGGEKEGLTYELIADGTALVERETAEKRPEMLTVYHLDGERLLLTHYCMAGNQPRMQLGAFNPSTGELKFEFVDGSNLASPAAGHMHSVAMRLVDATHMATEWQFYENGQVKMTEAAQYTRVR